MRNVGDIRELGDLLKNERQAQRLFVKLRWPGGVRCPYCSHAKTYRMKGRNPDRTQWRCAKCRRKFSCTTGTVFEGSHILMSKWLQAIYMICSSKKGVSANQIHRMLGVAYSTAWFMMHRIRWSMTQEPLFGKLGGAGRIVEVDETYVGGRRSGIHTNFAENYFSLFKRGVMGTFHNMGRQHIDRYLNEFSFRWSNRELNEGALMALIVRGSEGMRLTYRPPKDGKPRPPQASSLQE